MAVDSRDPDSVTTRELRYNNQPSTKHNIINLFTKEITKDRDERTLIFDGVDEVTAEGVRLRWFSGAIHVDQERARCVCFSKPTLVVESGWSESRANLHRDRNVWLTGAATTTEVVLILKWSRSTSKKVKGDIEVWTRDTSGAPILLQQEVVYPKPPPQTGASQIVKIKKSHLFGQAVANGNANIELTVDHLRDIADEYIQAEGYTPA